MVDRENRGLREKLFEKPRGREYVIDFEMGEDNIQSTGKGVICTVIGIGNRKIQNRENGYGCR